MFVEIGFDPVILQLGPFQLGWHGVFTVVAVAVALWLGVREAEQMGFARERVEQLTIWAFAGGVVGARLFHVLDHLPEYGADPLKILRIWEGGIAVYGALLGGIAGGLLAARRHGLPGWPLLDAATPAMLVGQAIGRVGCLTNGDAWGGPCTDPLCLVYQHPNVLLPLELHGVPTHPYVLYEIIAELALLAGLVVVRRRSRVSGDTFLVGALGYAAIRFTLSFLRQETVLLWGLQEAQLVALATGLFALAVLLVPRQPTKTGPSTAG